MLSDEMGCFFILCSDYPSPDQEATRSVHANRNFLLGLM